MKTLKFIAFGLVLLTVAKANAQVSVSVNINAPAPAWIAAPVADARFYYLPDIQVYYDRPAAQFIYLSGNSWVRARQLPVAYSSYDLYHGRTVSLSDYRGYAPYSYYKTHRMRYAPRHYAPARTVYVKERHGHGHARGHYKKHHKHRDKDYRRY